MLFVLSACLVSMVGQGRAEEQNRRLPFDEEAAASANALQAPQDWIEEKTGGYLPLEALFVDEQGREVHLGQLIDRPTLLLPVYYTCPSICSFDLANLADSIRRLQYDEPTGFRVLSLSFNSEDTSTIAAAAKPNYTHLLSGRLPEQRWSFLTGSDENIRKVTQAIGYRFQRNSEGIFVHPSALIAVDKKGQIIKYIYGSFIPGDVELALKEAAEGRPSTSIRRLLAFCFPANPRQNAVVLNVLKIASAAVLIGGGFWLARLLRKKNPPQLPPT
ncbi:MAG: SCO family protein [Desulfobulbus sp.]|nr:SCO family protein [Desulfobulbus sp.]